MPFIKKEAAPASVPEHVAIIMDGNGRWAKKRGLPRTAGHREGAKTLRRIIRDLDSFGVKYATFYCFSTENWSRSEEEVSSLMKLLEDNLDDLVNYKDENIRLRFIGGRERLSENLVKKMENGEKNSVGHTGMTVTLAINYGGRDEIVRTAQKTARLALDGKIAPEDITEELFGRELRADGVPDVDLMIRTGGELRLSNFLIWENSYAELYFTDTLWCDFSKKDLEAALAEFSRRSRRFGDAK